jgi:hypothetical protein
MKARVVIAALLWLFAGSFRGSPVLAQGYRVVDLFDNQSTERTLRACVERTYRQLQNGDFKQMYEAMPASLRILISARDFTVGLDQSRLENIFNPLFDVIQDYRIVGIEPVNAKKSFVTVELTTVDRWGQVLTRVRTDEWFHSVGGWINPSLFWFLVEHAREGLRHKLSSEQQQMIIEEEVHDFVRDE